ncbi:MAG: signal peptidase I [Clostridiales bacterium]|nr:signal peptidase I [Clostridiales bacterium]
MLEKNLKDTQLYEEKFGFKERNSTFRFYIVLLSLLLLIFGLRIYFTTAFNGVVVDGKSMSPTLMDEQHLLMRPVNEKRKADYGDIIVVYVGDYPEFQGATQPDFLIKRLIAKEGDAVKCIDGQVYVRYKGQEEFTPLNEPYANYIYGKNSYDFTTYEVGEGEIFFLGDNRQRSMDSRYKENPPNQKLYSKLDRLYKEEDIYGIVPDWAVRYDGILKFFFFPSEAFSGQD